MTDAARNGPEAAEGTFHFPVLVPETPIFSWLEAREDGAWPALAVLDMSRTTLQVPGLRALVQAMGERGVRVVGLTGLEAARLGEQAGQLPPLLPAPGAVSARAVPAEAAPAPPAPPEPAGLVVEGNLRSGQSVRHMAGDVSVIGSVASGAEVAASGSVHVYGALRGRASAGEGQIFCLHLAAELLAIGGVFLVAEDMDPALLGRAVRAVREGDAIRLHPLGA